MLEQIGKAAKAASYQLAILTAAEKNRALFTIADLLSEQIDAILAVNSQDVTEAIDSGLSEAMVARLRLTPARLVVMINDVRHLCSLADPIGQLMEGKTLDNGLRLERRRVPLGVVGVIYEARPNVTIDVATLCLKTSNAVILRGGKEARRTNAILVDILQQALEKVGLPLAAVQFIDNTDRALVHELLRLDRYVDILIPRGGVALHELCREKATIPVISGGTGMCHIFVDEEVEIDAALKIIHNAKTQRPSNSNSVETVLVHQGIAESFLPLLAQKMGQAGVILHASSAAMPYLMTEQCTVLPIGAADYDQEWLSLDLNVALVASLDEAIAHIHQHNTQHSEAILTRSMRNASRFIAAVDSSVVYVNASTRFTDGGQFGLGSEVAISTQKLHARGPMGLDTLTTYKWVGYGDNLIRS